MVLKFQTFIFLLEFSHPVFFDVFPSFLFRSLLGKELRKMSCVFPHIPGKPCVDCGLRDSCIYSAIFETPIPKDNPFLKGRNKAPHPFVFYTDEILSPIQTMKLELTLFGEKIRDFLPYFFRALTEAGKNGILKKRIPYVVKDLSWKGRSLLDDHFQLNDHFDLEEWTLDENSEEKTGIDLKLSFLTPLRLQVRRQIKQQVFFADILRASLRRMNLLSALYGDQKEVETRSFKEYGHSLARTHWKMLPHYSARQKRVVKLGGVVGDLFYQGQIERRDLALLLAANLFHIGKNISFGFGKIGIEAKAD